MSTYVVEYENVEMDIEADSHSEAAVNFCQDISKTGIEVKVTGPLEGVPTTKTLYAAISSVVRWIVEEV